MTPMQAIQAATSVTAELFGLTDVGTLAPGMQADIVAVPGNPLEDITALESVSFVMKGGTVHKAPLRDEPWRRTMTGQAGEPSRSNSPSR